MQVTISGDMGSGKSTVGAYLADKLGAELIDCGQLYRKYAASKDMSVLQLNQSGDNSIDKQIDNDLIRMGEEDKPRVYVSRTAWHFIPNAVHVYMTVNPKVAAERIYKRKTVAEEHSSIDSIIEYNRERMLQEDTRYESMYGITRKQQMLANNLFVHVGRAGIEDVCKAVYTCINVGNCVCFDPRVAIPTQVLHDTNPELVEKYRAEISGDIVECSVKIQMVNGLPYIADGHHRVAAACLNGVKFLYTRNLTVSDFPLWELSSSDYYDWEDYVKGDMSSVINTSPTNPVQRFMGAVNKM